MTYRYFREDPPPDAGPETRAVITFPGASMQTEDHPGWVHPAPSSHWPEFDSAGGCALCREHHENSPREHHRSELAGGRYSDECPLDPATGVAAPVDPESPGVTARDLAEVIAGRLQGVTPTPSGWVQLDGSVTGEQVMVKVTTWTPASQLSARRERTHPVNLGEALP